MEIFFRQELLEYAEPGHPESPARLIAIVKNLQQRGRKLLSFEPASTEQLLAVHSSRLVESVRSNTFFDPDCPNIPFIFRYASLAAGGAIKAATLALSGTDGCALIRPPGHHAGKNFLGGFCYFNNLAIAVAHVLQQGKRVAILDIDGHHGNGTEDIFRDQPQVAFASLHEAGAYPFTGVENFGNCRNYPLASGISPTKYLEVLDEALEFLSHFSPDILAVSLGFDTHAQDPLLHFTLRESDFFRMGSMIRSSLKSPAFLVFEGGYNAEGTGRSFICFLDGWERVNQD